MEKFVIKFCFHCKEIKPSEKSFCTYCGSQLVIPPTEKLKLEVAARIVSRININGNGNAEILRKIQKLSMASNNDLPMKFCRNCETEKPVNDNFCDEHGSRLTIPRTDRERLAAIGWLLYQIKYHQDEDSTLLLSLRLLITERKEELSLTVVGPPG